MKRMALLGGLVALTAAVLITGCPPAPTGTGEDTKTGSGKAPAFTLAWSEYPSWSVFGVAAEKGLINGGKGMGRLEEKWNVDVILKEADYDPCVQGYASGNFDAVCITNMDALNPALGRKSVAVLPTSTSVGADACIVDQEKIKDVKDLKNHQTFGLAKSVSEYAFVRCLEEMGEDPKAYKFTNMDPAPAATALQTGQKDHYSIMVWNPYKLETLNKNKKAKVLFDSSKIPEEIIDMVVVAQDSLDRQGGDRFVQCVIDTYYEFNKMLADPKQSDELIVALGEKFSHLKLEDMKKATTETRFYSTGAKGLELYESPKFQERMGKIVDFCVKNGIVEKTPTVKFSTTKDDSHLRFDTSFIKKVAEKK